MIKLVTSNPIKLANGETVPSGELCTVEVDKRRPTVARLWAPSVGDFSVQCRNLWRYFGEFLQVTDDMIEEAIMDGDCPSIYDFHEVEPDGWDPHGFPSILVAMGII